MVGKQFIFLGRRRAKLGRGGIGNKVISETEEKQEERDEAHGSGREPQNQLHHA